MAKTRISVVTVILMILLLSLTAAIFTVKAAKGYYNRERLIFAMADPKGDDHGPGSYKYPIDSIFDPKKDHFDLNKFSFYAHRNNYYFDMKFPLVTNPWGASEGFSHTIIELYISTDSDSGRIEPFREGANVLFDSGSPWKYLIKVVSFNRTAVYWDSDFEGAEGRSKGVKAQLLPDKQTIRVTVPTQFLPGEPWNWKYYVLVGSQSGNGPDNFRPVRASVGQWNFGGGTDTAYSPNVIDILAPPGSQEKLLGSFSAAKHRQAVLEPVGPTRLKPGLLDKFLGKSAEIMQKLKFDI